MTDLLVTVAALSGSVLAWRSSRSINPVVVLCLVFAAGYALRMAQLLLISPTSWLVAVMTVSCIAVLVSGHLLAIGRARRRPIPLATPKASTFTTAAVVLTASCVAGYVGFRRNATALAGADSFESLSAIQIRATDVLSAANPLVYLATLYPLLAVLGIYGFRKVGRPWVALTAVAVLLAAQGTNRTNTMLTALAGLTAFAIIDGPNTKAPMRRIVGVAAVIVGALVAAVMYFNRLGDSLNKLGTGLGVRWSWIPEGYSSAILYLTGGPSAFSEAVALGVNPWAATDGRSLQAAHAVLAAVGLSSPVPDLNVAFVNVPVPYNMYTGIGDLFFDIGLAALVLYVFLMGLFSGFVTRLWLRGSTAGFYLVAFGSALFGQFYFSNSLLITSTVVPLTVGLVAFYLLGRGSDRATRISSSADQVIKRPSYSGVPRDKESAEAKGSEPREHADPQEDRS